MLTAKNVLCIQIVNEPNWMRGLNAYKLQRLYIWCYVLDLWLIWWSRLYKLDIIHNFLLHFPARFSFTSNFQRAYTLSRYIKYKAFTIDKSEHIIPFLQSKTVSISFRVTSVDDIKWACGCSRLQQQILYKIVYSTLFPYNIVYQ